MQTVKGPPTATRPPASARRQPWLWLVVLLVIGSIAAGVVWLLDEDDNAIEPAATPAATAPAANTQPVVTSGPAPTQAPDPMLSKTPMPSMEALIGATYASVEARDTDAFYALRTPEALHSVYYSAAGDFTLVGTFTPTAKLNLATDQLRRLERLGPPIFSGMIVAVPGEYRYATETEIGFDLFRIEKVKDGYLIAEQATVYAKTPVDPEVERFVAEDAGTLVTSFVTAWNEGDVEAARATFAPNGESWSGWHSTRDVFSGDGLTEWIADNLWIEVVAPPEEAVVAGPFLVVPNTLINSNNRTDTSDGMSLFMLEDGKIALHIFHQ